MDITDYGDSSVFIELGEEHCLNYSGICGRTKTHYVTSTRSGGKPIQAPACRDTDGWNNI